MSQSLPQPGGMTQECALIIRTMNGTNIRRKYCRDFKPLVLSCFQMFLTFLQAGDLWLPVLRCPAQSVSRILLILIYINYTDRILMISQVTSSVGRSQAVFDTLTLLHDAVVDLHKLFKRHCPHRLTLGICISHLEQKKVSCENPSLKPLHTVGKVSLNASILYKNQEICNKTNLLKFQLISLFHLRENSKNAFSIFVLILMAGVFVSRDKNSLLDLISLIIRKR